MSDGEPASAPAPEASDATAAAAVTPDWLPRSLVLFCLVWSVATCLLISLLIRRDGAGAEVATAERINRLLLFSGLAVGLGLMLVMVIARSWLPAMVAVVITVGFTIFAVSIFKEHRRFVSEEGVQGAPLLPTLPPAPRR